MRKLIIEQWISLDGFATDKNNKLAFFTPTVSDIYKNEYHATCLDSIDCIWFGKNTCEQFSSVWPDRSGDVVSEKINKSEKIVYTNSLTSAPWGKWAQASIVSAGRHSKMNELKKLQGKNIIIRGSLTVAQQARRDQLVDEYLIHICPIITGGGKRLFPDHNRLQSVKADSFKKI